MELEFLKEFITPTVLGICLCVGYVIKHSADFIPNKYIPALMLVLGTVVACCINAGNIDATVVLGGMASGLASTGLYEMMRNFIVGKKEEENNE